MLCTDIFANCASCVGGLITYVVCTTCEPEYLYYYVNSTYSYCKAYCGDSAIQFNETCDDGNSHNADGCNNQC